MHHITRCLNSKLLNICQRAILLEELNTIVYKHLSEALREHCNVGSFTNGCLNIVVKDSVWAAQLRYSLPELRNQLRAAGIYQLASIKVTILPVLEDTRPLKKIKTVNLSTKAKEMIVASAAECDYLPLKQALEKFGCKS